MIKTIKSCKKNGRDQKMAAAWINCESEMPTPREYVLVFCPKSYYRYRVAEWTGGCWFTEKGEKIDYVHSWHKLPESTPEMAAEVIDRDECLDMPDWLRYRRW